MKLSCPSACLATLCLVVYLAVSSSAANYEGGSGEADYARAAAYRENLLSSYEEGILGRRLAYLYEQRHTTVRDAKALARLDRAIASLRAVIPVRELEITIIHHARPEALSFPPGRIFITTALIDLASTDDELVAVIAHEAAHIYSHHLAHLLASALSLPEAERKRFPSRASIISGQSTQFAFPTSLARTRLRSEMEADKLAVEWLKQAGYRSTALAQLLYNLSARLSPRAHQERASLQSRVALLTKTALTVAE